MSNEAPGTDEEKVRFAALLLRDPTDPFKAALTLTGNDTQRSLRIANFWPGDATVIAAQNGIAAEDELEMLPGKADLCRIIWKRATREGIVDEDFVKVAKLYAEVRGYIAKPDNSVSVNLGVTNNVMVVTDMGTDEEWERKTAQQQRDLLNVSTSRH